MQHTGTPHDTEHDEKSSMSEFHCLDTPSVTSNRTCSLVLVKYVLSSEHSQVTNMTKKRDAEVAPYCPLLANQERIHITHASFTSPGGRQT